MAIMSEHAPITEFDQWYTAKSEDTRNGGYTHVTLAKCATSMNSMFEDFKREHLGRTKNYHKLEKLANGEVLTEKKDLPNISSGETAGLIRRMARNMVQHTPNLEIMSKFDDDSVEGIFTRHVLLSKVVGSDEYSNDMQQNLFSSTKSALTVGYDCVIPVLLQNASSEWYMKYDTIGYQDVFPEPGVRDIRQASNVFVRRYLTKGEVKDLIRNQVDGWDILALQDLLKSSPRPQKPESVAEENRKHRTVPSGYEIITWYSDSGDPFLTFSADTKNLLRIEKNKHPQNHHPVFFLVLEKDAQQPLGKSQVELLLGRQEFQDLMFNGAMKMWYRNINPAIIGYGAINSIPNLSPGKYTEISNPNARVEPFEVNTQTLLQHGAIAQQNLGSMVQLVGAADQQMAAQSGGGMSATPQGVDAQEAMVDITTNNYQKAIESFFSHYCSYALTLYFAELQNTSEVVPSADTRAKLINAGLPVADEVNELGETVTVGAFNEDGSLRLKYKDLAVEYFVRAVPGTLVELEDEKQQRILNEIFVPLSQAMPALAAAQDQEAINHASAAMRYIIEKQIELSGSTHSTSIKEIFGTGNIDAARRKDEEKDSFEDGMAEISSAMLDAQEIQDAKIERLEQSIGQVTEVLSTLFDRLGISNESSAENSDTSEAA